MLNELKAIIDFDKPMKDVLVVRVKTCYYRKKSGKLVSEKSLNVLKKKSTQMAVESFEEDLNNYGDYAETLLLSIVNLNDVDDGVYELKKVNITQDFQTGYVDGWDYKLFKINVDK